MRAGSRVGGPARGPESVPPARCCGTATSTARTAPSPIPGRQRWGRRVPGGLRFVVSVSRECACPLPRGDVSWAWAARRVNLHPSDGRLAGSAATRSTRSPRVPRHHLSHTNAAAGRASVETPIREPHSVSPRIPPAGHRRRPPAARRRWHRRSSNSRSRAVPQRETPCGRTGPARRSASRFPSLPEPKRPGTTSIQRRQRRTGTCPDPSAEVSGRPPRISADPPGHRCAWAKPRARRLAGGRLGADADAIDRAAHRAASQCRDRHSSVAGSAADSAAPPRRFCRAPSRGIHSGTSRRVR